MILSYLEGNHKTWDKHLHEFRFAMNTATQASTNVSPALSNFGRHPEPCKCLRRQCENRDQIVKNIGLKNVQYFVVNKVMRKTHILSDAAKILMQSYRSLRL